MLSWLHSDLYKSYFLLFHQDDMGEKGDKAGLIWFITWNPREMKMLITKVTGMKLTNVWNSKWGFWKKTKVLKILCNVFNSRISFLCRIDWLASLNTIWSNFWASVTNSFTQMISPITKYGHFCTCEHCPFGLLPYLRICSKVSQKSYHEFHIFIYMS